MPTHPKMLKFVAQVEREWGRAQKC